MKAKQIQALILIFGIAVPLIFCTQVQEKQETSYYPYWHQRASLFKELPNSNNEIIFLGDSITDGCNWSELFQDIRIKNRGISGDLTDGILERLDEVTESFPLKIFLMIGVNDLADNKTVDYIVNNIKRIIRKIQKDSPKTEIYLEGVLPVNPDFGMFGDHTNKTKEILLINKILKEAARKYNITYIDLHSLFATSQNKLIPKYTNDGLHLTGAAYLVWKSAVKKYVN